MRRYFWLTIVIVAILAITISISAEFNYGAAFSDTGIFTRKWATDWVIPLVTVIIAYLALKNIGIARSTLQAFRAELSILEKTHRIDVLPILEVNLRTATQLPDLKTSSHRLIDVPEIQAWSTAFPNAADNFLLAEFKNLQGSPAGAAFGVQFRAVFKLPKHPGGTELLEIPRVFTGFWLRSKERWDIAMVNLKGVPSATIDITEIIYYDNDGLRHKRAYGFCFLEILQVGDPVKNIKVFAEE